MPRWYWQRAPLCCQCLNVRKSRRVSDDWRWALKDWERAGCHLSYLMGFVKELGDSTLPTPRIQTLATVLYYASISFPHSLVPNPPQFPHKTRPHTARMTSRTAWSDEVACPVWPRRRPTLSPGTKPASSATLVFVQPPWELTDRRRGWSQATTRVMCKLRSAINC